MRDSDTVTREDHRKPNVSEDNQKLLDELLKLTVEELINCIKTGAATASHLNVARSLLKDNYITVSTMDTPIGDLVGVLPFQDPSEDEEKAFRPASAR
jgi:hypothetical protein